MDDEIGILNPGEWDPTYTDERSTSQHVRMLDHVYGIFTSSSPQYRVVLKENLRLLKHNVLKRADIYVPPIALVLAEDAVQLTSSLGWGAAESVRARTDLAQFLRVAADTLVARYPRIAAYRTIPYPGPFGATADVERAVAYIAARHVPAGISYKCTETKVVLTTAFHRLTTAAKRRVFDIAKTLRRAFEWHGMNVTVTIRVNT